MHEAFITGSQVYGTPTPKSDVDLAIFLPEPEFSLLQTKCGESLSQTGVDGKEYPESTAAFRFGKLNLLVFRDSVEFEAWRMATVNLTARKPVTRAEATQTIAAMVRSVFDEIEGSNPW